ncbi:MAG: penicillin-binding protein 2 [Thiovulaceae bacterium]|nr:penicillin-binding protein 2 [Sulfurimonadaceae bacterium]
MRAKIVVTIFILVWVSLIFRVYYLAIQSNTYYDELATRNTVKTEYIVPIRGEILDRNKKPIAINNLGFRIKFAPHLSKKKNRKTLDLEISKLVEYLPSLDKEKLLKDYIQKDSPYNHTFIEIVDFVPYKEMFPVYSRLNLRENIKLEPAPKRHYPYGEIAAHLLGYVSKANRKDMGTDRVIKMTGNIGKNGIESQYNNYLQGEAGLREIKVSAYNEEIAELKNIQAVENRNLTLSIDIELQKYIKEAFGKETGVAIVMDTKGAVLAAVSLPEYDLNIFVSGISKDRWTALENDIKAPFSNKIISGLYPPGSVVKTGLGLIYATSGKVSPWGSFNCTGSMELGKRNFRCWRSSGHKDTNLVKAIRESCDDYFYKGSLKVGIEKMSENLMRYGLGKKTGIDLPHEFIGTIPSKEWKKKKYNRSWFIGETLNSSIGQGDMLVTPIQIAQFTALMATGKLPTPHIAMDIGPTAYSPEPLDILSKEEKRRLPIVRKAMREVCSAEGGTATAFIDSKVKIAGKTGTAQVVSIPQKIKKRLKEHELAYFKRSHAWLTTYGPYSRPKYIVSLLVEHGGHGGKAAGPIATKIYDWLYDHKYIKRKY